MIPLVVLPFLKSVGSFLKSLPREVWYGIAILVVLLILRSHWINVGVERCEVTQEKAQKQAQSESIVQELNAPVIAQKAQDAVKPQVIERVRIIREQIKSLECNDVAYPDGVQQAVREASASANRLR